VTEVRYGTEDLDIKGHDDRGAEKIEQTSGETRKVSILGLTLSAQDLRPPVLPSPTALTPSTASPVSPKISSRLPFELRSSRRSPSASPTSSSSSLDEDTQMLMSQSLAYLPPRTPLVSSSPSSSMASSMYQSAISTVPEALHTTDHSGRRSRTPSPGDHSRPADVDSSHIALGSDDDTASDADLEAKDEMLLSFGVDPIVIRLTTPPLSPPIHDDFDEDSSLQHPAASPAVYHRPSQGDDKPSSIKNLKLTFSAGVLACAFRAWHIRGMLDMLDAWGSHQSSSMSAPPAKPSPSSADAIFALGLDASANMRGVVILLLPSEKLGKIHGGNQDSSLDTFFTRPLLPPRLAHGCVRISLDSLSTSCSLSSSATSTESVSSQGRARAAEISAIFVTNVVTMAFALNDLSVFALSRSASSDTDLSASPILITDQNLSSQYSTAHVHPSSYAKSTDKPHYPQLPDFAIIDWTNEAHRINNSTKLSTWRTKAKPKASKRRDSQTRLGVVMPSSPSGIASNIAPGSPQTMHGPAVTINATFSLASSEKGQAGGRKPDDHVEIGVIPLHIFLDLGLALGSDHVLTFLDHAISSRTSATDSSCGDNEECDRGEKEEENTFPITPQERNKMERETERQRLERLVLEDLDLDLDYRDNQTTKAVGPSGQSRRTCLPYKVSPTSF
jgi:autophagy-related protein 2